MNNVNYNRNARDKNAGGLSYSYHGQGYGYHSANFQPSHHVLQGGRGGGLNYTEHVGGLSYSYHRGVNRSYSPGGFDISGHSRNGSYHNHNARKNYMVYSNHGGKSGRPRKHFSSHDSNRSLDTFSSHSVSSMCSDSSKSFMHTYKKPVMPAKKDYVALDCEMVATGETSCCARVVLVDWKGRTILDEYTKPTRKVTDYRTFVSGIKPEHLVDAEDFEVVREKVKELLSGKILVGHALENDLKCLNLEHPWQMIRDTANYEPFMKNHYGLILPRKLKELSQEKLQREIQVDGKAHSPMEDAIAALDLYKSHRPRWEACVLNQIKEGQRAVIAHQTLPEDDYPEFFDGIPVAVYP